MAVSPANCRWSAHAQSRPDTGVITVVVDKRLHVGVIDLRHQLLETPEIVAAHVHAALTIVPMDKLLIVPECGKKYLPRDVASGKLASMVSRRERVRTEQEGRA